MAPEYTKRRLNLITAFRNQFISEDLPGSLYHYTSINNFKSIVGKNEVWATAAEDLDADPTEITIAKSIAQKVLKEREEDFYKKSELYAKCRTIIEHCDTHKEHQFVFSFTEEDDLQSQWTE